MSHATGSTVTAIPLGATPRTGKNHVRRVTGTLRKVYRDKHGKRIARVVSDGKVYDCAADSLKSPRKVRSHEYRFGKTFNTHVLLVSGEGDREANAQ